MPASIELKLQDLPFAHNALEPHISERTLRIHHGRHHQTYLNNLNQLLAQRGDTDLGQDLAAIVINSAAAGESALAIFNNAAQVWNHDFFWQSLTPGGGESQIPTAMQQRIDSDFGSYQSFADEFVKFGTAQFGSGWVWLCYNSDPAAPRLTLTKTSNADTPLTAPHLTPLLVCDVWEHAYYLDFENKRADFINSFLRHLVNWDFALSNLNRCL